MAISDEAWSTFSAADYTPAQWANSCLIDTGMGTTDAKDRYKVPILEPDGDLNRNAVHAAAGGHGIGAVTGVSTEIKQAAAKKLVGIYRGQLQEDPPASLLTLAGMKGSNSMTGPKDFIRDMPFELSDSNSDGRTFEGYAAVFNSLTRIDSYEGEFDEQIAPGAFARSLQERMPVFQFDHGKHPLIGSMPLGVITDAREDSQGLYISARLTDNWLIQPVRDAVRDGAIDGMSFRFTVPDGGDSWVETRGQVPQRTLNQVSCRELGPVVFPAYELTTAGVRSLLDDMGEEFAGRPGARSTGVGAVEKMMDENSKRRAIERARTLRLIGII